jgi:hypothetical protein
MMVETFIAPTTAIQFARRANFQGKLDALAAASLLSSNSKYQSSRVVLLKLKISPFSA